MKTKVFNNSFGMIFKGICLLGLVFLVSCQKESLTGPMSPEPQLAIAPVDFLGTFQDVDDERVNQCLYDIGVAARAILINKSVAKSLVDFANSTTHHEVDLLNFLDSEGYRDEFRTAFAIQTNNDDNDLFDEEAYINTNLEYDINYRAKVYVPNLSTLSTNNIPVIAAGIQINEEEYTDNDDDILSWTVSGSSWTLGALDETDAKSSADPVFIIINGNMLDDEINVFDENASAAYSRQPGTNPTNSNWLLTTARINYRYEASGDSDYRFWLVDISTGTYHNWNYSFPWPKDDINTTKTFNKRIFCQTTGDNLTPCNSDVATTEYDWYAGQQQTAHYCDGPNTIIFWSRMKFSNEWYQFDPYIITNNPTGMAWITRMPNNNSTTTQNDGKGAANFMRVNN